MIIGIGTDIIDVERVKRALERQENFEEKIFTLGERGYCKKHSLPWERFAGRWAAKEAIKKTFGALSFTMHFDWHEIEILNAENGQPFVIFSSQLQSLLSQYVIHISISHCETYATAFAILEKT